MDNMKLHFDVDGEDFTRAGEASGETKRVLKGLGFDASVIRNVSIAMYEGEINMVIHAGGGEIDVEISPECISMVLADHGPGIGLPNIKKYTDEMKIDTEKDVGTTISLKVYTAH